MKHVKVAYIIVCWNNRDLLQECIESIQGQTHQKRRIIVVDNNSIDDSVAFIEAHFPEVDIIKNSKNDGFAKGNNIGIRKALEDKEVAYVVLLNTDATLAPNWTETILGFAAHKPRGASFQTITVDYYDHAIIDSTHIYVAHNGQATQGSWRRPLLEGTDVAPYKVFGCNAAAVMYSRAFIEAQPFKEFFDETMFMYLEDVDVAARATVMGWDNYVVPGSRAYHMGSASSSKKDPSFSLYMTFRNNSGMLVKNFHSLILLRMLPKLVRGDIDTIKVLWRTGRRRAIRAVIKGRIIGICRALLFIPKRYKLKRHIVVDKMYVWKLMHRGFLG